MHRRRPARRRSQSFFSFTSLVAFAWGLAIVSALPVAAKPAAEAAEKTPAPTYEPALLQALSWREVGPYRGGRSAAVTGIPGQPNVYYFGSTGGGVWKTTDGGARWRNVSDGYFGGSIGAVAVATWDPNVIYVGGGEKTVRGNVSHGGGVWKSTDAGQSWTHKGLPDSRHIPRIRIHPRNPDHVYAAVLGHLAAPNPERGVYRSLDGGDTWARILHVSDEVGAVDLAMDPTNPRVLYATFWRVKRTPWSLESGGEGSGLYKSTDSGDHWQALSDNPGLPVPPLGISGITVSPTNPQNLYAIIEAEEGGVFRSTDGGETWKRTNKERGLRQRAWYYSRIYADPADEEGVYVVNVRFHRSKDGGRTFTKLNTPHGDNHDLWIAPGDPQRMIESNDGGANVSFDGGVTWSTQANQPTAQFYRVSTDNAFPYRLLGGQQDNSTVRIRSRALRGSTIDEDDWEPTAGGESGHVVAKPDDPEIVYGGSYGGYLTRYDHRSGQQRAVNVWPDDPMGWGAAELSYRFQWNFPIFFSPHDPNVLYAAANVLFRSRDEGASWQAISPDLTRDDKSKLGPSGGPITKDNTSVEYYGTIFAALESPHEPGVLWTGSDDGLIHLSRDDGATWQDRTPAAMPAWMQINSIEAHPFEKGGLYVAGTRYKLDDFRPYLYRTTDYGATWTEISRGIDPQHFTRVIRADPDRRGLLYAGTERGVYVSFDDGGRWQPLQLDLPIVPITDLAVKQQDLIAATQGRGFWILDDLIPLHQLSTEVAAAPAHLFTPRPTYGVVTRRAEEPVGAGTNPPPGVLIRYYLASPPEADTTYQLEILESSGEVIRTFERKPPAGEEKKDDDRESRDPHAPLELLEAEAGLNQVSWDLSYPGAEVFPGLVLWNDSDETPTALPGTYRARLTVGTWQGETSFEVKADPRSTTTPAEREARFRFQIAVRDKLSAVHRAIRRIRAVRAQIDSLAERLTGRPGAADVIAAGEALDERMTAVEEALYQTKNQSPQDPLNFPIRLNDKLAALFGLASIGDYPPTAQMVAVKDELVAAIDVELATLEQIWQEDLPAYNAAVREADVAAVLLPVDEADDENDE